MLPVGVFRDAPLRTVGDIATLLNLHAVQLHGHEDTGYVRMLRRDLPPGCEVWTALSVGRGPRARRGGDRRVVDNANGGRGRILDLSLVEQHPELQRAVVAGGISRYNAADARRLGAHAIDVGSSLDFRPGRKSPVRIAAYFGALRPPSRERTRACA
jgi:indole-3-glycerol phosphate synthase/phosphoribosylanthranilate isomerase